MGENPDTKSLQVRDGGFNEIAQTVLRAVNDLSTGVNRLAADTVLRTVKEAYLKGYQDGYRQALQKELLAGSEEHGSEGPEA